MEKRKKKVKILGMKLKDIIQLSTIIGGCIWGALYLDGRFDKIEQTMNRKFDQIDGRFDDVDRRFDQIDHRLDNIENDLNKTRQLLNKYLTWRFIYVNDPVRKNLRPVYDPLTETLEFVDKNNAGK